MLKLIYNIIVLIRFIMTLQTTTSPTSIDRGASLQSKGTSNSVAAVKHPPKWQPDVWAIIIPHTFYPQFHDGLDSKGAREWLKEQTNYKLVCKRFHFLLRGFSPCDGIDQSWNLFRAEFYPVHWPYQQIKTSHNVLDPDHAVEVKKKIGQKNQIHMEFNDGTRAREVIQELFQNVTPAASVAFLLNINDRFLVTKNQKKNAFDSAILLGCVEMDAFLSQLENLPSEKEQSQRIANYKKKVEEKLSIVNGKSARFSQTQPVSVYLTTNVERYKAQGGNQNADAYCQEYRKAVAFLWNAFEEGDTDILFLLKAFGYRRHNHCVRQARSGSAALLKGIFVAFVQGILRQEGDGNQFSPFALYHDGLARINQLHGENPNKNLTVSYALSDGKILRLTQISSTEWTHRGENEEIGLKELDRLTRDILKTTYSDPMHLAKDLHRLYWLFAHLSPYKRGTPTISGQFMDALWLHKGYLPPKKTFDENIEALCHLTWESFSDEMMKHLKNHPPQPLVAKSSAAAITTAATALSH